MKLGPYAIEQDYSQYVSRASEVIFAIVGTATKGPVGEPTVVTSPRDLVTKFGGVNPNCLGLYAANYFLNQSSKIWYVRVAHEDTIKAATVSIAGASDTATITDALKFEANSKGSYYNGYKVEVTPAKDGATFTMTIKNSKDLLLETIKDISLAGVEEGFKSNYLNFVSKQSGVTKITKGSYELTGGDSGIKGLTSAEFITAGKLLASGTIDMNLFAIPGCSDPAVIKEMLTLAETRGDCVFIVDPPNNLTADAVADWHNGTGEDNTTKFNSSYGVLYYAWQNIYDSVNGVNVEVPPSVVVAPTIAKSAQQSEIWYPAAGLQRGLINGALESVFSPDNATMNNLYTGENSVNCIINDPQVGLCIFGQKTLYREDSALNRLNVRMLLNYLKRVVVAACRHLTFEPNDRITWNRFEDMVTPVLTRIQNSRGLYEYQVVKGDLIVSDEDIDNYRMPCKILLKPTKSAEEIPIYFTITNTGADFNEVLSEEGILNQTI